MGIRCVIPTARLTKVPAVLPMDGVGTLMPTVALVANLAARQVLPHRRRPTQPPLDRMLVVGPLLEELPVTPMAFLADAAQQLDIVGRMLRIAPTAAKAAV